VLEELEEEDVSFVAETPFGEKSSRMKSKRDKNNFQKRYQIAIKNKMENANGMITDMRKESRSVNVNTI